MQFKDKITLAFSGASGAPYGLRLLEVLLEQQFQVYVLISSAARVVFDTESNIKLSGNEDKATEQLSTLFNAAPEQLKVFGKDNWFSPVASAQPRRKKWWYALVVQVQYLQLQSGHQITYSNALLTWLLKSVGS